MKYIRIPTNDNIPEMRLPVTDENIARAPLISVTGKYEIIDDGGPEPPTIEGLASENKLLKQQVSALTDQQSFYDDCIAEMATVVYA